MFWVTRFVQGIVWTCATAVLTASLTPSAAAQGKKLNNLVSELVSLPSVFVSGRKEVSFDNPRAGWVYFEFRMLDDDRRSLEIDLRDDTLSIFSQSDPGPKEAMRYLSKGGHAIVIKSESSGRRVSVVIRTMPETHFVRFPQQPRYRELGDFSWRWLDKHVLSSVNTLIGVPGPELDAVLDDWVGRGKKVIAYGHIPHNEDLTGTQAFDYWNDNPGFQDSRFSGVIADEFQGRQHPLYPAWIEGMSLLGDAHRGTGKMFYGYSGGPGMYTRPEARRLVQTVFQNGFRMAWERYHHELPTLPEATEFMDELLGLEMERWQQVFPDCQRQMVLVLGIFATGPDLDVQPGVNYKVWMDMQMRYLATHPLFDGLFGVHWWYSGAANEELLRWESALYRHYCIEGNTSLLSEQYGWTYELKHVSNPDFVSGFDGWTTGPASTGSMRTGYLERYARIQNRYWHRNTYPDDPAGNTYAWMKRRKDAPNRLSQVITGLSPGSLYTAQLISATYTDIVNGKSEKKNHALSLNVLGAETVEEGTYFGVQSSSPWSHDQLPFENGPAQFNHHRVMFRATGPTAELVITDWGSSDAPMGPIGEELMLNYVQVQPYFRMTE